MKNLIRFSVQLFVCFVLLTVGIELLVWAQSPLASPSPSAAVTIAAPSAGIMGWIGAHGGLMAVVMAIAMFMNAVLSGVRSLLCFIDGVPPGGVVPANYAGLNAVNIAAIWVGRVIDYLTANVQH